MAEAFGSHWRDTRVVNVGCCDDRPPNGQISFHVTHLFSPEGELFADQLQQFRVTERQEVYDFIDPSEKLVPPEMSLWRNQRINNDNYRPALLVQLQ